jgi:hypothetical protein
MNANDNVPSINLLAAQSLDEMLAMIRASDHLVLPAEFRTLGGDEPDSDFAAMIAVEQFCPGIQGVPDQHMGL